MFGSENKSNPMAFKKPTAMASNASLNFWNYPTWDYGSYDKAFRRALQSNLFSGSA